MKRVLISVILWASAMILLTACAMGTNGDGVDASGVAQPADSPVGLPARPGSGA